MVKIYVTLIKDYGSMMFMESVLRKVGTRLPHSPAHNSPWGGLHSAYDTMLKQFINREPLYRSHHQ